MGFSSTRGSALLSLPSPTSQSKQTSEIIFCIFEMSYLTVHCVTAVLEKSTVVLEKNYKRYFGLSELQCYSFKKKNEHVQR